MNSTGCFHPMEYNLLFYKLIINGSDTSYPRPCLTAGWSSDEGFVDDTAVVVFTCINLHEN